LLSASTLFKREHYTEAFVVGWTLIEAYVNRLFESYWTKHGRRFKRVKEMNWSAAHCGAWVRESVRS